MKTNLSTILLLFISCALFAQETRTNKVLIIGIDGCRPDALLAAHTPHIDRLCENGTYSWDALNDRITVSGPGWSSMLTGVWPNKHGVTDNLFTGRNYEEYPPLFQRIEAYNPDLETICISQWPFIGLIMAREAVDTMYAIGDETHLVTEAAIDALKNRNPDLLFLHFDDVDHAGHADGFSAEIPEYIAAIEEVDEAIGAVMATLKARPTYDNENWLILSSTDHGGIGTGHGGETFEERNIFFIASGDYIPNQEIKRDSVQAGETWVYDYSRTPRVVDIALSALEHLCIPVESNWLLDGKSVGVTCQSVVTGIEEVKADISIAYPNPIKAGGSCYIHLEEVAPTTRLQVALYDLKGQKILDDTPFLNASNITLPKEMVAGIYFMKIITPDQQVRQLKLFVTP